MRGWVSVIGCAFLLVCSFGGISEDAGLKRLDAGLKRVVEEMLDKIEEVYKPQEENREYTVTAVPFVYTDGVGVMMLGCQCAEIVNRHLANSGRVWLRVSERIRLNELLQEQKFWLLRIVEGSKNPAGWVDRGEGMGLIDRSDVLVVGTVSDIGRSIWIEVRAVMTRTAQIVCAAHTEVVKSVEIRNLMRWIQRPAPAVSSPQRIEVPPLQIEWTVVGAVKGRKGWESVDVREGRVLRSGDGFLVKFKPLSDCYVYLLLFGSGGKAQCLFPWRGEGGEIRLSNYCLGGKWYTVPEPLQDGKTRWYKLDNVTGEEALYLVACYEPMRNLDELIGRMDEAGEGNRTQLLAQIRGLISRGIKRESGAVVTVRGVGAVGILDNTVQVSMPGGGKVNAVTELLKGEFSLVKKLTFKHR